MGHGGIYFRIGTIRSRPVLLGFPPDLKRWSSQRYFYIKSIMAFFKWGSTVDLIQAKDGPKTTERNLFSIDLPF